MSAFNNEKHAKLQLALIVDIRALHIYLLKEKNTQMSTEITFSI